MENDLHAAADKAKDSTSARRAIEIARARWLSDDPVPTGEVHSGPGEPRKFRDPAKKFER